MDELGFSPSDIAKTLTYRGVFSSSNGRGNKRKSRSTRKEDLVELESGLWLDQRTGDIWLIQ